MNTAAKFPAECGEKCIKCGACVQKCPAKALELVPDGFETELHFRPDQCINCGACKVVCPVNKCVQTASPKEALVATATNQTIRENSASGGAFSALAKDIISQGGIVYGAAWTNEWCVSQKRIFSENQIPLLQGSKYVRSEPGQTFLRAKEDLESGKQVLYSGTPCLIAGLRAFLQKEYPNLLTCDVICHGTPNAKVFSNYINFKFVQRGINIDSLKFRAHIKNKPGCYGLIHYNKCGIHRKRVWLWQSDPYYYMYMMGKIYQSHCYVCPFASKNRVSDITLGDPWGLESVLKRKPGNISLILCNTRKGFQYVNKIEGLRKSNVNVKSAIEGNGQLNQPVVKPLDYDDIVRKYQENGAGYLECYFKKHAPKSMRLKAWGAFYTPDTLKEIIHGLQNGK